MAIPTGARLLPVTEVRSAWEQGRAVAEPPSGAGDDGSGCGLRVRAGGQARARRGSGESKGRRTRTRRERRERRRNGEPHGPRRSAGRGRALLRDVSDRRPRCCVVPRGGARNMRPAGDRVLHEVRDSAGGSAFSGGDPRARRDLAQEGAAWGPPPRRGGDSGTAPELVCRTDASPILGVPALRGTLGRGGLPGRTPVCRDRHSFGGASERMGIPRRDHAAEGGQRPLSPQRQTAGGPVRRGALCVFLVQRDRLGWPRDGYCDRLGRGRARDCAKYVVAVSGRQRRRHDPLDVSRPLPASERHGGVVRRGAADDVLRASSNGESTTAAT